MCVYNKLNLQQAMLSTNEENAIKKLVQRRKGLVQQVEQQYFNTFKQAISLFNAASYLSELVLHHNMQLEERLMSLYLLLVSFHDCNAQSHPFVFNILYISLWTQQPFDRIMIYEILIRGNKNKYGSYSIDELSALASKETQMEGQQKQIKNLRAKVEEKYKQYQTNLPFTDDASHQNVPQFLRLVPEYIPISVSELNWLSPGIICDVEWDNSAQIDKKLQKCRKIFENSLKRPLEPQQRTQLLNSIESDPYSPLHIGFNSKDLNQLIIHNSYIAASLVIKLSRYPIFQEYLQQFLTLPTTVPLLDSVARIIKQIRVPQPYVVFFCIHHMNKMVKTRENGQNYKALAYTMSAFLRCMFENQIVSPYEIAPDLTNFMNEFSNIMDFGHIRVLLDQQNDFK